MRKIHNWIAILLYVYLHTGENSWKIRRTCIVYVEKLLWTVYLKKNMSRKKQKGKILMMRLANLDAIRIPRIQRTKHRSQNGRLDARCTATICSYYELKSKKNVLSETLNLTKCSKTMPMTIYILWFSDIHVYAVCVNIEVRRLPSSCICLHFTISIIT